MKQFLLCLVVFGFYNTAGSQNLSKLYAYSNSSTGGHFYTVDYNALEKGKDGFEQQKFSGVVHTAEDGGTSPVYIYQNAWAGNHFYTINEDEIQNGEYGYRLLGVAFYAYKKKVPGTVTLHRYFHQQKRTHFYSTQHAKQINGYGYEGPAFYIFPDEKTAKASAKKKDAVTFMPPLISKPFIDEEVPQQIELIVDDRLEHMVIDTVTVTIDTIAAPQFSSPYILILNEKRMTDLFVDVNRGSQTLSVIVSSGQKKVMELVFLQGNESVPAPGTYHFTDGTSTLPYGAVPVKLILEPGFVSSQEGELVVEHVGNEVWFMILQSEYIRVTDRKSKKTRRLTFAFPLTKQD